MDKYQTAVDLAEACLTDPPLDENQSNERFDELLAFAMVNFNVPSWDDDVGVGELFDKIIVMISEPNKGDAYAAAIANPTSIPDGMWTALLVKRVLLSNNLITSHKSTLFRWFHNVYGPYLLALNYKEAQEFGRKWENKPL